MPYRRNFRRNPRRSRAASKIGRAWRNRKRRKTGLVARTALSNRRQIRQMNKSVETKVLQDTQAIPAQQFSGQYADSISVDNTGQEVGAAIPFAGDLLHCNQGSGNDERVGQWIQLKSLTMHYCIYAPPATPTQDAWYELFVVLDRSPTLGASLTGAEGVLWLSSAAPAPNNKLALAFQNLAETGKKGRFKILARKRHRLSNYVNVAIAVPPILTAVNGTSSNRDTYMNQTAGQTPKSYPEYVQGSINLKLSHKINYGPDVSVQPTNQTIRVMAFQCNPAGLAQPRCVLQYYTRIRYKDA